MSGKRPRDEQQHHGRNHHHTPKAQKTHYKTPQEEQHNKTAHRRNGDPNLRFHDKSNKYPDDIKHIPNISPVDALALLDAKYPSKSPYPPVPPLSLTIQPQENPSTTTPMPITTNDPSSHTTNLPPLPPIEPGPLTTAPFTHPSFIDSKYGPNTSLTYERLEFLGDAYLEIIATRLIFSRFPFLPCGRQAQLREKLIKNSTLAAYSRAYGFGQRVKFSGPEMEQVKIRGGWDKVEADVFEAFVAAVVMSWPEKGEGFKKAEEWLTGCWAGLLLEQVETGVREVVNRKDDLVKILGGKHVEITYEIVPPSYDLKATQSLHPENPNKNYPHASQTFRIGVYLTGWGYTKLLLGVGVGIGKKEASLLAAQDAFESNEALLGKIGAVKKKVDDERRARMAREVEAGAGGGGGGVAQQV